jgi:T-complex protein 1 subunit delta
MIFSRGTVEDTEMVDGLVLEQKISHLAGGVSSIEKAKIGLIQFCLSAPKTDVCPMYFQFMYTLL